MRNRHRVHAVFIQLIALFVAAACADDWPDEQRLVLDGLEVSSVPGDFQTATSVISRSAADDLYVEIEWSGFRPFPGEGSPMSFRMRVGMRLEGAARRDGIFQLGGDTSEVFGVEHMTYGPLFWARNFPDDPRPSGRVRVLHTGQQKTLSIELFATLTPLGSEPRGPVVVEVADRLVTTVEARTAYAGQCKPHKVATYVPLQAGYELSSSYWERVERDCQGGGSGCQPGSHGPCGDGDRWLCETCFGSASPAERADGRLAQRTSPCLSAPQGTKGMGT